MNKRNLIWLIAIVAIGIIVWVSAGFVWGLLAAVATLVISETVERILRRRRAAAKGTNVPSVRKAVTARRKSR